jgi:hypothetical protein
MALHTTMLQPTKPIFATFIKAPLETYLIKVKDWLGVNPDTQELEPIADQWSQSLQYRAVFEVRNTIGSKLVAIANGIPSICLEYVGTLQRQIDGGTQTFDHQLRLIVAVPTGDNSNYSECENLRDYAIAALMHGLTTKDGTGIAFRGYLYTGRFQLFSKSRVQLVDNDTAYLCSTTFTISLRRVSV